jgi:hypothetical protein
MNQLKTGFRTVITGVFFSLAFGGAGRCEDPSDPARESIIQGVRDDVRRQIKANEAKARKTTVGRSTRSASGARKPKATNN